uniref:Uncharacterized protein n=1 Tax=Anopheles stephensi TaxID=30069 RepID=A0A182XYK1_ANOST
MERALRRYVKAHGYAIALSALFFGCIYVASILNDDQLSRSASECKLPKSPRRNRTLRAPWPQDAFFRSRPLEQLIFSIAWIVAGLIFLLGLICERKEAIFPFSTIFLVEWSLILVQLVSRLGHRNLIEVILSAEAAVFLRKLYATRPSIPLPTSDLNVILFFSFPFANRYSVVPMYVGYTLVMLYRAFDCLCKDEDQDIEQARRPVKFFFGEDPDDTYS